MAELFRLVNYYNLPRYIEMSGKEKLDWYTSAVLEKGFEQIAYIYTYIYICTHIINPIISHDTVSYNIPLIIIRHISHENSTFHPPVARCTLRIDLVFFSKGRFFITCHTVTQVIRGSNILNSYTE